MLDPQFARQLERVIRTHYPSLLVYLARRFPRLDRARLEDAVGDALEVACREPARFEAAGRRGDPALLKLLRVVSWRTLRAWYRRPTRRVEVTREHLPDHPDARLPDAQVIARRELSVMHSLVTRAARKTCKGRSAALEAALHDRLGGATDAEAGRRHGVPREYVNRARRWMLDQLAGR